MRVPFNKPAVVGSEEAYVAQALRSSHLSGDGPFTERCRRLLEKLLPGSKVLLTTSCTHALEMAAFLLEIDPGDEVIVPAFAFSSTINAFVSRGAQPVFVDVREDTLNLDERLVGCALTERTKAIVALHYAGVGCEMGSLLESAARVGAHVIEDNAHGLFGSHAGRPLGTFGTFATQSFHETKNVTCGEGGALVLNDERFFERAEIVREKGTDRSRFFRGEIDKYTWRDVGSSYLPSDILAAFLAAQLEVAQDIQTRRRRLWETYHRELSAWAGSTATSLPRIPANCEQSYHLFYLLLPTNTARDALIAHLAARDIAAAFHYLPLNASPMGTRFGARQGDCPVSEDASGRLLRLPFYTTMTEAEQSFVVSAILEFAT